MYIRQIKKQRSKNAQIFYQYSLVQNTRIGQRVKQENILYLGSDPLLADKENRTLVAKALTSKIYGEVDLFPSALSADLLALVESYYAKYQLKYPESVQGKTPATIALPPKAEKADFHTVDLNTTQVEEVKSFGAEHLCVQVADQLKLSEHLKACGLTDHQTTQGLIAILSRAIFSASEYKTSQLLSDNSALCELLGRAQAPTHKELYAIADTLYENRERLDRLLYGQIKDLFNLEDKLVIFDLSNTYFETRKSGSQIARYGKSKEKRDDCPLVVFTAVINAEGFIRHSRIYEGNQPDAESLEEMIADLEKAYGQTQTSAQSKAAQSVRPTVVMDAGIATEDNLSLLREKGYTYVCVARSQLKDYTLNEQGMTLVETNNQETVRLQQLQNTDTPDTWLYVQSPAKQRKEQSMDTKLTQRFEEQLTNIGASLHKKGGTKAIHKVWERIGRTKEKNRLVAQLYEITVEEKEGKAVRLQWEKKKLDKSKEDKKQGIYFIRTNLKSAAASDRVAPDRVAPDRVAPDRVASDRVASDRVASDRVASDLWKVYNTIREVESTFRCLKTDLNIRPIHHQKDERIQSHIYLTVLAYQVVNTIRHQTRRAGINDDWQNILRKARTQTIQNIVLPTKEKTIHLRKPSRPIQSLKDIYQACLCKSEIKAKRKYVVYH